MKKRPEIKVIQCPSGFWAVIVDGEMYDAASPDMDTANKIADSLRTHMMTAKEKNLAQKAMLLKRRCCELDGGECYTTREDDLIFMRELVYNLTDEKKEKEFLEYLDSLRSEIEKTPEQRAKEHEEMLSELLESEAEWESTWSRNDHRYRDEWDDLWSDRARSCGAKIFF